MSRKRRYGFAKPHLVALFILVDSLGSILATLATAFGRRDRPARPRRILLLNFAHIGDALMVTPALRAVRAANPEAHITVAVGPWSKDLLTANPYLDDVLVFRPSWWDRDTSAYVRLPELRSLVRLLRQGRFDLSINFKSFFQENLALWLARIPTRVGYGIYGGGFFLTHQVEYAWGVHTVEANMALIDYNGVNEAALDMIGDASYRRTSPPLKTLRLSWRGPLGASERADTSQPGRVAAEGLNRRFKPEMFVLEEDIQTADAFLQTEFSASQCTEFTVPQLLVAFHIGAGYPSKIWGEDKFAGLADKMASKWGARAVVVGGPDDIPLVTRMQQFSQSNLAVAAGRLSIRQTAALISRCHLFVGNDSGPAHIAAAIGVPTVAIFSGENEAAVWRPYADNCEIVQRQPNCAPCGKRDCDRDHKCMLEISVEDVLGAVERILRQNSSL